LFYIFTMKKEKFILESSILKIGSLIG